MALATEGRSFRQIFTVIAHKKNIHRKQSQSRFDPHADGRVEDDFRGGALIVNNRGKFAQQGQSGDEGCFALHHQLVRFLPQQLLERYPSAFGHILDGHFETRLAFIPPVLLGTAVSPSHDGRS